MATKKKLKSTIEELREELHKKSREVTKYVAVTNARVSGRRRRVDTFYDQKSYYLGDSDQTIVLVTRNGQPDTISLNGKWTINQIKEAANG